MKIVISKRQQCPSSHEKFVFSPARDVLRTGDIIRGINDWNIAKIKVK
jgi:hypothetical protein